ncbi:MAG: peptidylprolyl isomerase [Actinomycetota bacterium]
MRRTLLAAAVMLVAASCAQTFTASAAVVNGVTIETSDIETQIEAQVAANPGAGDPATRVQLERDLLTGLIRQELLRQAAIAEGLEASEEEIEAQFQEIRGRFGSDQEFQERLAAAGLDEETLRERLELQILQQELAIEIGPTPSESEIRERYEQNEARYREIKASHILYSVAPQGEEQPARRKADRALSVIKAGTRTFESMAQTSDDTASAKDGGSLGGFIRLDALDPAFAEAAWDAPLGVVVGPVRSSFGFHLIRVEAKRVTPLADVREEIEAELAAEAGDQVLGDAVTQAAQEATILVNPRFGDWDEETLSIVPHESYTPVEPAPEPSLPVLPDFETAPSPGAGQ